MSVKDIAEDLVALCKAGQFVEAGLKHHADDIVSIEAMGPPGMDLASRGKPAVAAKNDWWTSTHETVSFEVDGPFVHGDQFAVAFTMDIIEKATGQRHPIREIGLYTVRDDKVVEERFFYGA